MLLARHLVPQHLTIPVTNIATISIYYGVRSISGLSQSKSFKIPRKLSVRTVDRKFWTLWKWALLLLLFDIGCGRYYWPSGETEDQHTRSADWTLSWRQIKRWLHISRYSDNTDWSSYTETRSRSHSKRVSRPCTSRIPRICVLGTVNSNVHRELSE